MVCTPILALGIYLGVEIIDTVSSVDRVTVVIISKARLQFPITHTIRLM
jgi:hypothetical protein